MAAYIKKHFWFDEVRRKEVRTISTGVSDQAGSSARALMLVDVRLKILSGLFR
jgi:hypothetical protein